MNILVTGGLGYIGSHTIVELIEAGHEVIALDNNSNSYPWIKEKLADILLKQPIIHQGDILDKEFLRCFFQEYKIDVVIHFAGLKYVNRSLEMPLAYYENNIVGLINLLTIMAEYNVKNIIFSSSATIYGDAKEMPVNENSESLPAINPYGTTKQMSEKILKDIYNADQSWNIILLRYFNPVGAHPSGKLGEATKEKIPSGLMPSIIRVAKGLAPELEIFGGDYPTKDGTPVRDFIHVVDLAKAHVLALKCVEDNLGMKIYNVGTGKANTVLEMIKAFMKATGVDLNYVIKARRSGDVGICYADNTLIKEELGWQPQYDLEDMCRDQWNWEKFL